MFKITSKYSSYKALRYVCGRRMGEDSWCRLGKLHPGDHDLGATERWTEADDAAVAAFLIVARTRETL